MRMMRFAAMQALLCSHLWVWGAQAQPPTSQPEDLRDTAGVQSEVYRKVDGAKLKVHILYPAGHRPSDRRAAIVFFFGGGWKQGSAEQFIPQCRVLSSMGMVSISAEYRVYDRHQAQVVDCVADAQAAMRWVRTNASRLGIDPDRIAAGGGSAGGHLAAATATLKDFTGAGQDQVSFRPNALVLFNPALDLTVGDLQTPKRVRSDRGILGRLGAEPIELSPTDHVRKGLPPTIIMHGKQDQLIPFRRMEEFKTRMDSAGNRCELIGFEGQGHGFFNYRPNNTRFFDQTMDATVRFLSSMGYIHPLGRPASRPD